MVELMLNMYVCSILSHDVSKFVCLKEKKSLKVKVCGVFSLFDGMGGNQHGEERTLYF